ncbi:AGE family epimerase/isomerase [Actinoplanes hulinensis]|uniref:AGE family epimerase/isomerase n=1 Tax=Actinoplanes hulinensis TaxID=1144547 RepID=A0ABS7B206_9ACTN|nr:AGE family epimerase/isomerase [Actinoplanes hulinensis]MBW6435015.1 AGE family epimerase/isomerase [Actinoplanes hulinensis]
MNPAIGLDEQVNQITFTFSDLVAGYVTGYDPDTDTVGLRTSDGRPFAARLTSTTVAEMLRNLGEAYVDASAQMRGLLQPGRFIHVYGVFYPNEANGTGFEAKHVLLFGKEADEYRFESLDWWQRQVRAIADFYLLAEFGGAGNGYDFRGYRTDLSMLGTKAQSIRQETDTISRLIYGLSTAYLLSGGQAYLDAAVAGANYLVEHFCAVDRSQHIAYWYHAIDVLPDGGERKILASEFGDDYNAIPCYEQIYAVAGLTQVYRITGEPRLREIIDLTINLFQKYFRDPDRGGYYSHIDPVTFDPRSPALDTDGHTNADRKNWNSVGDHIPAYLINLYLATGEQRYADMLEDCCDTVVGHFPDYDASPFVQEKFFGDWSKDQEYGQQQNRAIVGHNLKIAWNLMRMNSLRPKDEYVALATRIADLMPSVGADPQRGGWYDMVERVTGPGEHFHRLVWHDRKAWWQQEQGILAYLILDGLLHRPEYAKQAREGAAFYNAWMLDTGAGGVYFNVLANGTPFELGGERSKGSHSMAMYHSAELGYLAAVYGNLLRREEPLNLWFQPQPGAFGATLRVAPDLLPPGRAQIMQVWINGHEHHDFDPDALTVTLPHADQPQTVRVRMTPAGLAFSADLTGSDGGRADISLAGTLSLNTMPALHARLDEARRIGCTAITLDAADLMHLDSAAVRDLALTRQHADYTLAVVNATGQVAEQLRDSELIQELATTGGPR